MLSNKNIHEPINLKTPSPKLTHKRIDMYVVPADSTNMDSYSGAVINMTKIALQAIHAKTKCVLNAR